MDITQLYQDFNINFADEGDRHYRPGWINTSCPHCTGNPGMHLGYHLEENYFYCWRCGWHPISLTISELLNITIHKAKILQKQYGGQSTTKQPKVKIRKKAHTLPSGIIPLQSNHRRYLTRRGFNPDQLIQDWKLVATGPIALLDGIDYKHRIIAPIYWNNEQVSFQGRDITNKHTLKYLTCPKDRELIHHKHILYGNQTQWSSELGICMEGITDVWRFGSLSFCTFGIEYTPQQVRLMSNQWKRIAVVFDPDPQAQKQAKKLVSELKFRGVDAWQISIDKDPGSMSRFELNLLKKDITNIIEL